MFDFVSDELLMAVLATGSMTFTVFNALTLVIASSSLVLFIVLELSLSLVV